MPDTVRKGWQRNLDKMLVSEVGYVIRRGIMYAWYS